MHQDTFDYLVYDLVYEEDIVEETIDTGICAQYDTLSV